MLNPDLEFALSAADRLGRIALEYFRTEMRIERKADDSPVTSADRAAEEEMRALVRKAYPKDGILGEEFGEVPGESGRRWIVDPIDGTQSFIRGVPLFGTLIGLEVNGEIVLGVAHLPALDETIFAAQGQGTWWRRGASPPRSARVSEVPTLSESVLCATSGPLPHQGAAYEKLRRSIRLERGWGDCCGHLLVATGRAEIMVDPAMNVWDCAALYPILREAGGTFTDWKGVPTVHGGEAISTNGKIFNEVLGLLRG